MKRKRKSDYKKYIFMGIFAIVGVIIILIGSTTAIINIEKRQKDNHENIANTATNMAIIKDETFENTAYANTIDEVDEKFIQVKQIVPENYNFLTRLYEGNLDDTVLYERIYRIVFEVIPDTYKELNGKDNAEIVNYYQMFQEEIFNLTGIESEQEYIKFVESVIKIGNGKYASSVFMVNNFVANDKYSTVDLILNFSTGSIILKIDILNNTTNDSKDIIFTLK